MSPSTPAGVVDIIVRLCVAVAHYCVCGVGKSLPPGSREGVGVAGVLRYAALESGESKCSNPRPCYGLARKIRPCRGPPLPGSTQRLTLRPESQHCQTRSSHLSHGQSPRRTTCLNNWKLQGLDIFSCGNHTVPLPDKYIQASY